MWVDWRVRSSARIFGPLLTAPQVQHVVPEVTIPPEVTPENVTTSIVDTSCMCSALPGGSGVPVADHQPTQGQGRTFSRS